MAKGKKKPEIPALRKAGEAYFAGKRGNAAKKPKKQEGIDAAIQSLEKQVSRLEEVLAEIQSNLDGLRAVRANCLRRP